MRIALELYSNGLSRKYCFQDAQILIDASYCFAIDTFNCFYFNLNNFVMLKEQSSSNDMADQTDLMQRFIRQEKLIRDLKSSTSWRLTAPLRWVARASASLFKKVVIERPHDAPIAQDYTHWIKQFDAIDSSLSANMRDQVNGFAEQPLFSILLPCIEPQMADIEALIDSVQAQIYPNWELCVAVSQQTRSDVRDMLKRFAHQDARIKLGYAVAQSEDLAVLCNQALSMVSTQSSNPSVWVLRLNALDLIANKALFTLAKAVNDGENCQIMYADEDMLDAHDVRRNPYFKCDWNPELHVSHNLIGRFGIYQTVLLKDVGGYSLGMGEALDFDLTLRCLECVPSRQIWHAPWVLFHARQGQPASSGVAIEGGVKALKSHFQRLNVSTEVKDIGHGYRIHHTITSKNQPLVSLIIPTRNGLVLLRQCITSIQQKTTYQNYEIIIVDNGSDDPATLAYFTSISEADNIRILRIDAPFNYSALNNEAVKLAGGELVGLINNDIEVISPGWLEEMVSHALRPGVGAVGARLWFPDNTMQYGGVVLGMLGVAAHSHMRITREQLGYYGRASLTQNFSAVTAACLVIKKSTYEKLGGLNQQDLTVAFNDVDFCIRVREAGYRNVWTPFAELYHHESASRGYDNTPEKQRRASKEVSYMFQRWWDELLTDPAYSPNLTLQSDDFSYAWPPRVESLRRITHPQPGIAPLHERLASLVNAKHRIAYFAENVHSSTFRYRAANMAAVLNEAVGVGEVQTCAACFFTDDLQYSKHIVENADLLVISRARYDADLAALVQAFHLQGKRVLFDIDDLVFDTQVIDLIINTSGQVASDEILNYWYSVVGRMAQTLRLCDGVITTNGFLANKIKQFINLPINIVPNFANKAQLAISESLYERKLRGGSEVKTRIKLGYFSGSASHNGDLALISNALERVMAADARIDLVLVGHVDLEQAFGVRFGGYLKGHLADRLTIHPFVDYLALQKLIADVDFNLVPLQVNDFTHCKSELKYVDAAMVGTCTIASSTYAYKEAICDGKNGYIAADDQWETVLLKAIAIRDTNLPILQQLIATAYQDVQSRFTWQTQCSAILNALEIG
jgi:O-antigen biosynthesis protein